MRATPPWVFAAASPGRRRVLELAQRIAPSSCTVLILGPTGVGKEVLAEDIHLHSPRVSGRFVAINCASLTPALFESELFGHQRGAYTGAVSQKVGLVELADRGTLFLDEVSELSFELQAKLLRFLARGTFWPVGGTEERSADVRVIAAANRDLRAMIPAAFREDLFYRLSVVPIVLPPLEPADASLICAEVAADVVRRQALAAAPGELDALARLAAGTPWRGGARELRSVLERYFLLRDAELEPEQTWELSRALSFYELRAPGAPDASAGPPASPPGGTAELMRLLDDLVFLNVAKESRAVRDLADRLGRTPQAIYDRLRRLGLSADALLSGELGTRLFEVRAALAPYRGWIQAILNESAGA